MLLQRPDVWSGAVLLVEIYSDRAPAQADWLSMKARNEEDYALFGFWRSVRVAAEELVRTRRSDEQLN